MLRDIGERRQLSAIMHRRSLRRVQARATSCTSSAASSIHLRRRTHRLDGGSFSSSGILARFALALALFALMRASALTKVQS